MERFQLYKKQQFEFCVIYFYMPVFRRDVLWYGDVRASIRLSVRLSVNQFPALFSYML